jgi:hypothetical protein
MQRAIRLVFARAADVDLVPGGIWVNVEVLAVALHRPHLAGLQALHPVRLDWGRRDEHLETEPDQLSVIRGRRRRGGGSCKRCRQRKCAQHRPHVRRAKVRAALHSVRVL